MVEALAVTPERWALGWDAVQAVMALLAFLVAALTLPALFWQTFQSRRAHVESLIETAIKEYLAFRSDLFDLDVKRELRSDLNWDDVGQLRMAAIRCETFYPSIRQMISLGTDDRAEQFRTMFLSDLDSVISLIKYSADQMLSNTTKTKDDFFNRLAKILEDMEASPGEIEKIKNYYYSDADSKMAIELYGTIRTRYMLKSGKSPEQIVEEEMAENATTADGLDVMIKYGVDHNPIALAGYWRREFDQIVKRLIVLKAAAAKEFGASDAHR